MTTQSPATSDDLQNIVYNQLLSMPKYLVLARADYQTDFERSVGQNNCWEYRDIPNHRPYETILVGEIMPEAAGSRFSAKGTHYIGSRDEPKFVDDKICVKSLLLLRKPSECNENFGMLFDNQLATLSEVVDRDIIDTDTNTGICFIKRWTSSSVPNSTTNPEFIHISTDRMYIPSKDATPASSPPRKKHALSLAAVTQNNKPSVTEKAKNRRGKAAKGHETITEEDVEMVDNNARAGPSTEANNESNDAKSAQSRPSTKDLLPPSVLSDYGGDLFKHKNSKLRQLDFRNSDDDLIPPSEWYSSLRQGTLVMVRASMNAYNWPNRRVYQLTAQTIKVLSESSLPVEPRYPTVFHPATAEQSTSNSAAADALSSIKLGKRRADDA